MSPPLHVLAGVYRVVAEPRQIRAQVGMEVTIAVPLAPAAGGMLCLHVPVDVASPAAAVAPLAARVDEFLGALVGLGRGVIPGCAALLVGGADVLSVLPPHSRERILGGRISAIEALLVERGLRPHAVAVGGTLGRQVVFDSATGEVGVTTRSTFAPGAPVEGEELIVDLGALRVARSPQRLGAVLGSCVGIALYDPTTTIGGLAHAVLPCNPGNDPALARYADTAVPALIDAVVAAGADRQRLQAKIAGCAGALFTEGRFRVGEENSTQARLALARAHIPLAGEETGGRLGRRISVDLTAFRVKVQTLGDQDKRR